MSETQPVIVIQEGEPASEPCEAPVCMAAFETNKRFFHTTSVEFQAEVLQQSSRSRWKALCSWSVEMGNCGVVIAALKVGVPEFEE